MVNIMEEEFMIEIEKLNMVKDDIDGAYIIDGGKCFVDENKRICENFWTDIFKTSMEHVYPKSEHLLYEIRYVIKAILKAQGYWWRVRGDAINIPLTIQ